MRTFRATARPVGKDPHRLDVTYTISEGPKVILDSVMTLGAKVTRQSLDRQDGATQNQKRRCRKMTCWRPKAVFTVLEFSIGPRLIRVAR